MLICFVLKLLNFLNLVVLLVFTTEVTTAVTTGDLEDAIPVVTEDSPVVSVEDSAVKEPGKEVTVWEVSEGI